jgi:hypothetical protein
VFSRPIPQPVLTLSKHTLATAEAEGLTLSKAEGSKTGLRGVRLIRSAARLPGAKAFLAKGYSAATKRNVELGHFRTIDDAALAVARFAKTQRAGSRHQLSGSPASSSAPRRSCTISNPDSASLAADSQPAHRPAVRARLSWADGLVRLQLQAERQLCSRVAECTLPAGHRGICRKRPRAVSALDPWPEDQAKEIVKAVETIRRQSASTNELVHGWRLTYTRRAPGAATRGDMCAIDPRDGQKIFSLVGLKRRLSGVDVRAEPRKRAKLSDSSESDSEQYDSEESPHQESDSDEDEDVYVVDRILAKRLNGTGSQVEYLCSWEGWGEEDNSWEPSHHILDKSLIAHFEAREQQHVPMGMPAPVVEPLD